MISNILHTPGLRAVVLKTYGSMGRNAKFIVTGDVTQIDLPKKSDSGLTLSLIHI